MSWFIIHKSTLNFYISFMLHLKKLPFFLVLTSILLIVTYIQQEYVSIPQLSNLDLPEEMKGKYLETFFRYRWLAFAVVPLIILLRVSYTALCLFLKELFASDVENVNYSSCFNVALKADIVMFGASILNCVLILCTGVSTLDLQQYISLTCLANTETAEPWLLIPLAAVNVFEVVYWFFMAKLFAVENKCGYWQGFRYVMTGYGVGYLFYIVLAIFLVLYLT